MQSWLKATVNVAEMQLMLESVTALGNGALFTALQALLLRGFVLGISPSILNSAPLFLERLRPTSYR